MSTTKDKKSSGRPWRDNIEAVTISIVTIVLFKYFVLEAYKIPTGSMQPTLMGNEETGIYDRVLVDKFSFHYRDPQRWEVAVFKYPLNRAQNFIKRIVGVGPEELKILDGDLWIRPLDAVRGGDTDGWHILRRPRNVLDTQLRELDTRDDWQLNVAGWTMDGGDIVASAAGTAVFPRGSAPTGALRGNSGGVRDGYTDGYPRKLAAKIESRNKRSRENEVSDLRVTTTVRADAAATEVWVLLQEGPRRFRFRIPGPAAGADKRLSIDGFDPQGGMAPLEFRADEAWKLTAGRSYDVLAQNIDDELTFEVEGRPTLTLEVPRATGSRLSSATLGTEGGGARFGDPEVYRDIFYTSLGQKQTQWTIPEGSFVVLGDNSQDSSDGRDWTLAGLRILDGPDEGEVVRGNNRDRENPRWTDGPGGERTVFIRDEQGELRWFEAKDVQELGPVNAPLVSRESIVGRAVLVVWPLRPDLGVYRFQPVR